MTAQNEKENSLTSPMATEARYKFVFENMPSGVAYHKVLTDQKGKAIDYIFVEINKSFERLTGLSKEKIIGKKVTEILPRIKHSIFNWIDFYGKIASSGKSIKFEQYIQDLEKWYSVSAYSPEKGYFTTIYEDITDRRKAEESLRKAYDTLKKTQGQLIQTEKMETVGRLASGVAHEVKNPLGIIEQGLSYISKNIADKNNDMRFALDSMADAAKRASSIISGLSDFSRVSNMRMEEEDINALIKNTLLLIKTDLQKNRINVEAELSNNLHPVKIDKNRIEQVFINLFLNSLQAMPKGGELKINTLSRKGQDGSEFVIAEIRDTGTGISQDILQKIFDPFFTTKDVGKGTGLGLSIVKSIVDAHGGKIKIENRKSTKGVRVTLEFKARSLKKEEIYGDTQDSPFNR